MVKKGDTIWNVSYDRFLKLTVEEYTEDNIENKNNRAFSIKKVKLKGGNNVFIDSRYNITNNTWFFTEEEANKRRDELVEYHKQQIEQHTKNLNLLYNIKTI